MAAGWLGGLDSAMTSARGPKDPLVRWFAKSYGVDLDEAENPDPAAYPTFNAFFTRELKSGARPIAPGATTVVSPVDGRLTEFGYAKSGQLLQAKGFEYALEELIGEGPVDARLFANGAFATIQGTAKFDRRNCRAGRVA